MGSQSWQGPSGHPTPWPGPSPVSPHHAGQRLVSFTTPEANMRRKSSQRTSQKGRWSWGVSGRACLPRQCCLSGATSTAKKPVSSSRESLWGEDPVHPGVSQERPAQPNPRALAHSHSPLEVQEHLAHLRGKERVCTAGRGQQGQQGSGCSSGGGGQPHLPGRPTGRQPRGAGRRGGGAAGAAAGRPGPAACPAG